MTAAATQTSEIQTQPGVTVRLVRKDQVAGQYKSTGLDADKKAAEFRLTSMGKKNTIVWADGRAEQVTDARLAKLQASHSWACDF